MSRHSSSSTAKAAEAEEGETGETESAPEAAAAKPKKGTRVAPDPVTKQSARELFEYVIEQGRRDYQVQRYKGLGEMTSPQFWETTMDPDRRTLLSVKLEDLAETEHDLQHAHGRGCGSTAQVH